MDVSWECPKCGASNEDWRHWCRGCTTTQDAARAASPSAATPGSTMLLTRPLAPPIYAPAQPRRSRRWPKVLAVVIVAIVALGAVAFVVLKQTDPGAGRDRDRLVEALPPSSLFPTDDVVSNVESFARTRAGLRLADGAFSGPGCDEIDRLTTEHGTAGATEQVNDTVNHTAALTITMTAYETDAFASSAYSIASGSAVRQCLQSAVSANAGAETIQLSDTPTPLPAPAYGDQSTAYRLAMTVTAPDGTAVAVPVEVVVFRSRRAVATMLVVGSPDQPFPDDLVNTALSFTSTGVAKLP